MARTFLKLLGILIITYINLISAEDHTHFNASILIKNERLLGRFVDCILDEGPCIGPLAKMRTGMPQLFETQCEVCQEQMKVLGAKVMLYIRDNKPDKWAQMREMYDTDHIKQEELEKLLETMSKSN